MAFLAMASPSEHLFDAAGVQRIVQRSFLNATALGNTQIVASQGAGLRIRVLAVMVVSLTALTIKFQSATTDICSGKPIAANGGYVAPFSAPGWFETNLNEALNVNLSISGTVGIDVLWIPVG